MYISSTLKDGLLQFCLIVSEIVLFLINLQQDRMLWQHKYNIQ